MKNFALTRDGKFKSLSIALGVLATLAFCLACGSAYAIPVTWQLQGVVFTDGGTATGSFVFAADANVYSDISITTTAGMSLPGATSPFDRRPDRKTLVLHAR